jgi:hypothetical protein
VRTPKDSAKQNSIWVDFARSAFGVRCVLASLSVVDGINTSYQPAESIASRLAILA